MATTRNKRNAEAANRAVQGQEEVSTSGREDLTPTSAAAERRREEDAARSLGLTGGRTREMATRLDSLKSLPSLDGGSQQLSNSTE